MLTITGTCETLQSVLHKSKQHIVAFEMLRTEDCNWNVTVLIQKKKERNQTSFLFWRKVERRRWVVGWGARLSFESLPEATRLLWVPIKHPPLFSWELSHLTLTQLTPRRRFTSLPLTDCSITSIYNPTFTSRAIWALTPEKATKVRLKCRL